jgi:hypothetical protein
LSNNLITHNLKLIRVIFQKKQDPGAQQPRSEEKGKASKIQEENKKTKNKQKQTNIETNNKVYPDVLLCVFVHIFSFDRIELHNLIPSSRQEPRMYTKVRV